MKMAFLALKYFGLCRGGSLIVILGFQRMKSNQTKGIISVTMPSESFYSFPMLFPYKSANVLSLLIFALVKFLFVILLSISNKNKWLV